ncbi:MAG: DNA polymerase I [Deltaproteobacteria bacterium]|nr:DNA polymerase I [Deltaproteobacteria bacterium]
MNRIHIIDATAFIFRAYHGVRELTSPDGFPTNAIYGYLQILTNTLKEFADEPLIAVFDAGQKTFRNDIYEFYKANRPPAPEELKVQIPKCIEFTNLMGIPVFTKVGFEADDIIASYTRQAEKLGISVMIHSADKDLMQLVNEKTVLYDSMRNKLYDEKAVKDKFGVEPLLIGDLLSLMGDSSDNIPGVKGIGPKTAAKLLNEYGSLEKVLNAAEQIGKSVGSKLTEHRDAATLSRVLVTLREDVPLDIPVEEIEHGNFKRDELEKELNSLGFGRFMNQLLSFMDKRKVNQDTVIRKERIVVDELPSEIHPGTDGKLTVSFHWSDSVSAMPEKIVTDGISTVVLNIKTDLLTPGVSFEDTLKLLKPHFENPHILKVFHPAKEIYTFCKSAGIEVNGIVDDISIQTYVLNPSLSDYSPGAIAEYTNYPTSDAGDDAGFISALHNHIVKLLENSGELQKVYTEIERPLIKVLSDMEMAGILLDQVLLSRIGIETNTEIELIERQIREATGKSINLQSPKQLSQLLFNDLGLPVVKKTKTGYSTDVEVLEKLSEVHYIPELILQHRTLSKLKNTYIDVLGKMVNPHTARLHGKFNQTVASTGRLSSSEPNLQNIPVRSAAGRKIRQAFIAPEGRLLLSLDYSQIELRVLAHLCGDPNLVEAFKTGKDIHSATAMEIFSIEDQSEVTSLQRSVAKEVNFGVLYGQSGFGLSKTIGISRAEAKEHIDRYFERFPSIRKYLDDIISDARKKGYAQTMCGRRRPLEFSGPRQGNIERMAMNTPIQGSAADIIKIAMIKCHEYLEQKLPDAQMVLSIHDELVFEVRVEDAEKLKTAATEIMENAVKLNVPLRVEGKTGKNWFEAH